MWIYLVAAFVLKALVAVYLWGDKLTEACYQAALHVRSLEGRPFTPAESSAERAGLKVASNLPLGVPILGSLGVMIWPDAALPRSGKFAGAEPFRQQVRRLSTRAFLLDAGILLTAVLYFLYLGRVS